MSTIDIIMTVIVIMMAVVTILTFSMAAIVVLKYIKRNEKK